MKTGDVYKNHHNEIIIVKRGEKNEITFHHSTMQYQEVSINTFIFDQTFKKITEICETKIPLLKLETFQNYFDK